MENQTTRVARNIENDSAVSSSCAPRNIDDASTSSASATHNDGLRSSTPPATSFRHYDIFINHRGPDVKNTFATSLYRRLISSGFQVFLDKPELEEGYTFSSQIEAAIKVASVHIAVFSPTYAASKWCLDELVLMVESQATILPVFYNVTPSVVRWTEEKGAYAEALREHQKKTTYDSTKPRCDSETIERWRTTLSYVSNISGFELEGDDVDNLLDRVVQGVLKKLPKPLLDVARYPTGLEEKLEEFETATYPTGLDEKLEELETTVISRVSVGSKVAGIVGTGGVGKTTLAKHFFNRRRSNYNSSSFLFDVKQKAGALESLKELYRTLINDLKHKDITILSRDHGLEILRIELQSCRVLIVLDDVDDAKQLEDFLPVRNNLSFESLILVTSRDKHVLTCLGVLESSIYNLNGLNVPSSKELFCSYAFGRPDPRKEFADLVDQFITACDGLPLSLKVFGALVAGENNRDYWKEQLVRLRKTLPSEIENRLRISYDSLTKEDKLIFLDIVCFFIGEDRDTAIRISGMEALKNLENKCMLEVDTKNKIKIHDHIRDMGRNIAREGSMPLRLYQMNKLIHDLTDRWSSVITEAVRGIKLITSTDDFFQSPDCFSHKSKTTSIRENWYKSWDAEMSRHPANTLQFSGMRKLQFVATQGHYLEGMLNGVQSTNVVWLRWYRCPYPALPPWIPMKNLRVLEVEGRSLNTLWLHESSAPAQLRELKIWAPLSVFPRSVAQMKNLEKIVIYNDPEIKKEIATLQTLPDEFCDLQGLKYLQIKCCLYLKNLPDSFGNLSKLQYMALEGVWSLQTLPISFGRLPFLKHLCFSYCHNLTISNGTLENISTLEYLDLSNCHNVKELPTRIGNLCKLEVLKLEGLSLELLPPSFVELIRLKDLSIRALPNLKRLPDSFGRLSQLTELSLWQCGVEYLPQDLPKMKNLQILKVSGCPLRELPFPKVEGDTERQRRALNKLDHSNDKCMFVLKRLELDCTDISEITFFQGLCPDLRTLVVRGCSKLKSVQGLGQLSKLLKLDILFCHEIEELDLGGMESFLPLQELTVYGCEKLKSIRAFVQLTKLLKLYINECHKIEELTGVEQLILMEELNTHACRKLRSIQGLEHLSKLQILVVRQCRAMQKLPNIEHLISLKKLDVSGCDKLKSIQGLRQLPKLQLLNVAFCHEMRELPGVEDSISLEELDARKCPKLHWGAGAVQLLQQELKERLIL